MRWLAMYVPPPPEFETQHTVALLGSEMSRSYTSTSYTTLASPQPLYCKHFSCRNYFLGTLWVDDENSELQLFAIYAFLHVDAVEYS